MIELDLTRDEAQLLVDALESHLSDLRMEIADTDSMDYRENLKVTKGVLIKVIETLKGA